MKKKTLKAFAKPGLLLVLAAVATVATPPVGITVSASRPASTGVHAASTDDSSAIETFTTIDVPGAVSTVALDINNDGVIVGRYAMAGRTHGFLRTPDGEFMTIDFPGSSFTVAASINDENADIVGQYALPSAPTQRHGFLLKEGVFTSFDPPGSTFTNALGINERGDIVGRYCTLAVCRAPGTGDYRGFLLRDGEFIILDAPDSFETDAFAINNHGKIVGGFVNAAHGEDLFLWRKDEFTALSLPNGKSVSVDKGGINERGDIVGFYCDHASPCVPGPTTGTHGFAISRGEFRTIDVPDAVVTTTFGINARGDIVGGYTDASRRAHGFLLSR